MRTVVRTVVGIAGIAACLAFSLACFALVALSVVSAGTPEKAVWHLFAAVVGGALVIVVPRLLRSPV